MLATCTQLRSLNFMQTWKYSHILYTCTFTTKKTRLDWYWKKDIPAAFVPHKQEMNVSTSRADNQVPHCFNSHALETLTIHLCANVGKKNAHSAFISTKRRYQISITPSRLRPRWIYTHVDASAWVYITRANVNMYMCACLLSGDLMPTYLSRSNMQDSELRPHNTLSNCRMHNTWHSLSSHSVFVGSQTRTHASGFKNNKFSWIRL